MRTQSLLPNSSPRILKPMANGFQVVWDEAADHHVLQHNGEPIAAHHNGYSCHELAKRILTGNTARALDQFDYIKACGGTLCASRERLEALTYA